MEWRVVLKGWKRLDDYDFKSCVEPLGVPLVGEYHKTISQHRWAIVVGYDLRLYRCTIDSYDWHRIGEFPPEVMKNLFLDPEFYYMESIL